jgi:hypothetical protein
LEKFVRGGNSIEFTIQGQSCTNFVRIGNSIEFTIQEQSESKQANASGFPGLSTKNLKFHKTKHLYISIFTKYNTKPQTRVLEMTTNKLANRIMDGDSDAVADVKRLLGSPDARNMTKDELVQLANAVISYTIRNDDISQNIACAEIVDTACSLISSNDLGRINELMNEEVTDVEGLRREIERAGKCGERLDRINDMAEAMSQLSMLAALASHPSAEERRIDMMVSNNIIRVGAYVSEHIGMEDEFPELGNLMKNYRDALIKVIDRAVGNEPEVDCPDRIISMLEGESQTGVKHGFALKTAVDAVSLLGGREVEEVLERAAGSADQTVAQLARQTLDARKRTFYELEILDASKTAGTNDNYMEGMIAIKVLENHLWRDPEIIDKLGELGHSRIRELDETAISSLARAASKNAPEWLSQKDSAKEALAGSKAPDTERILIGLQKRNSDDFRIVSAINDVLDARKERDGLQKMKMPPPVPAAARKPAKGRRRFN